MTTRSLDRTIQILEKMTLYGITKKYMKPGESEFRYKWTSQFIDHINIMGERMSQDPELAAELAEGSKEDDFEFLMAVISEFLAIERLSEQWAATEPEWKVNSSMHELYREDIAKETHKVIDSMSSEEGFTELRDITRMVNNMMIRQLKNGKLKMIRR